MKYTLLNFSNVILILGCLFFAFNYGWEWYLIILIVWGLGFWKMSANTELQKEIMESEKDLINAKAEYYRRKKK